MVVTLLGIVLLPQPINRVLVAVSIIALQLSRLSYVVLPSSTTIEVREEQPEKVPYPMLVTLLEIVMEVREEQSRKAQSLMLVTLLGIVIEVREEQPSKA